MNNGKTALLAVVMAGVLLTLGAIALRAAASNPAGPSLAQIDASALMAQARDLPDQAIENLF